ncbi:hypothetical protein [Janthinobacterium sp. Ant5-2-1]|uniref:hypothetical protein n=1 Tax=Janthinobacterium sp. Ant5-2-1 TaxID=1755239 RepID=UPI000717E1B3|nr:hypothetical protein [Janthinobacterium sp. Ant5-2-1]
MSNYIRIAGSPATGIVLLGDDGTVRSLAQVEPNLYWRDCASAPGFLPGDTAFACLLGDGAGYTTLVHGTAIRFLAALGQPLARWKDVAVPPAGTGMAGLAGDHHGYLLLAADGHGLYRLDRSANGNGEWNAWERCPAPPTLLRGKATLIAGDWQHGMLAVGDGAAAKLARGDGDWKALPPPPLAIEMVSGNFQDGFIAYGEGQLCMLDSGAQPRWSRLSMPNFDLRALSGNPVHGVAAVLADSSGHGTVVAYALRPGREPWSLALAPPRPAA